MSTPSLNVMREYLLGHFRYGSTNEVAYATNIKLHQVLPFNPVYYTALGNKQLMTQVFDTLENFSAERRHIGCYTDGRSGGYLVLNARRKQYTGEKAFCKCCGQRSFRRCIDTSTFGLADDHPAWPMVHEMIKLTGMSAGNPLEKSEYFAWWARNHGSCSYSYFELFTLAERLLPLIVGRGSILKCGKCGSQQMSNFKEEPFHWVPAGAVNDTEETIDEMDETELTERYNLVKAFDQASYDLILEFKFQAEHWDDEEEEGASAHPSRMSNNLHTVSA